MYTSHWHHTSNAVAVLPTTLILYIFVQLFVFRNRTRPAKYAHYLQSWMKVNDACHHCITNKLLTIYLQPLQKNYITKKPRKSLVYSHRPQWKHCTHSSRSQSVSFHDWSMWSAPLSERRRRRKVSLLIVLIGSLEKKFSSFVNFPTGVKERIKNLQSLPLMVRYGKNWMRALAIYIQHPLSWCL